MSSNNGRMWSVWAAYACVLWLSFLIPYGWLHLIILSGAVIGTIFGTCVEATHPGYRVKTIQAIVVLCLLTTTVAVSSWCAAIEYATTHTYQVKVENRKVTKTTVPDLAIVFEPWPLADGAYICWHPRDENKEP